MYFVYMGIWAEGAWVHFDAYAFLFKNNSFFHCRRLEAVSFFFSFCLLETISSASENTLSQVIEDDSAARYSFASLYNFG